MLSNAYFLAKIRFDTAENEPAKNLQNFRKMHFRKMQVCSRSPRPARGTPDGQEPARNFPPEQVRDSEQHDTGDVQANAEYAEDMEGFLYPMEVPGPRIVLLVIAYVFLTCFLIFG